MSKSSSIYTSVETELERKPLDYSMLSREQFDVEMEKGLADLNTGRTVSSKLVRENMRRKYRA